MSLYELEGLSKKKLAKRVYEAKGLTAGEKMHICYYLTGDLLAPPRQGRPSTKERDMDFACEYLVTKNTPKWETTKKLAQKHGIPSDERARYKALERGIKKLKAWTVNQIVVASKLKSDCEEMMIENKEYFQDRKTEINNLVDKCSQHINYFRNILELIKNHSNTELK